MAASTPNSAAVGYLLARIAADIDFLVSQSLISVSDAQVIRSRLPASGAQPATGAQLAALTSKLSIDGPEPSSSTPTPARAVPPPPARAPVAPPPAPGVQHATALWAYESGNPDDLRFAKGDVIEVRTAPWRALIRPDHRDAERALAARSIARPGGSLPGQRPSKPYSQRAELCSTFRSCTPTRSRPSRPADSSLSRNSTVRSSSAGHRRTTDRRSSRTSPTSRTTSISRCSRRRCNRRLSRSCRPRRRRRTTASVASATCARSLRPR